MRGLATAGRCQVKTGTLRRVSALAGYCRTAGGRDVGFALMFNRARTVAAKKREDRIVAAIARLTSAPAAPPEGGGTAPEP
jgi:D-alanyl-D-alanine carboxypeptidase